MGALLTDQQVRETRAAMLKHSGNLAAVARELGIARSSAQSRAAALASGRYPEETKPRVRVKALSSRSEPCAVDERGESNNNQGNIEGVHSPLRVCVIGDLHVAPGQDLSRLKWIARHIGETQPDQIVQIGDWSSFDSVSTHDPIGSIKQKHRPSLRQDMESLCDSLALFDRELGPSTIPRLVTLGNHEVRVARYEELRSELDGSVWTEVLQEFARYRWKTYDFGKVVFIGGVGFVHVPINGMGKPHSSPNIIGHNLTHDLIRGHSHKAMYSSIPKIGESVGVTLIDVGTSLPHGHVEPYAKLTQTGWYWGLHDVIIRDGRIDDFARVSMKTLESRYG